MMKIFVFAIIFVGMFQFLYSQENPYKVLDEKDVNFLFNYYEQDGEHSPVTGGIGTEKLECAAPLTQVVVPYDSVNVISVNLGVDYYTSASCDRIDRFVSSASSQFISSASSDDLRAHFDFDYSKMNFEKHNDKGMMFGFSHEFDVNSFSTGLHYSKSDTNENKQISLRGTMYYDIWKLIYPGEIRDGTEFRYGNEENDYDLDRRITSTLSMSYSQVVTKRLQFVISTDIVYQNGILNTPFHRVYFDDGLNIANPDSNYFLMAKTMYVENLPRSRYKIPISIRMNYYVSHFMVARFFYRFYFDDFDIMAHTFSVEIPLKLTSWLMIYPMYRYYIQTASKYFAEFGMHQLDINYQPIDEFYTSDYDLSAFSSNKIG